MQPVSNTSFSGMNAAWIAVTDCLAVYGIVLSA
jgi:hypothetical protein